MSNTATRLIHLIMLLQRRPNQKAAGLASELGVSVRTLHRYFAMLDELGIPVYSERGPYGGFSLVRGYKMPPLVLSPEEAVAICLGAGLAEDLWGRLYREAARSALVKIENLLPDDQRQEVAWARRSLAASVSHRVDFSALAPLIEKLRSATHDRRKVHLEYQPADRPALTRRAVDPYALVHRYGWWYVIGHCHLRGGLRVFRLDRIRALELLPESFEVPADFDLQAFLGANFRAQPQFQARLRFLPGFSHVALNNRAAWDSVAEQPDGSAIVTLSVPEMLYAASTALAYGPIVEVLDPPELRREVLAWARAIIDRYAEAGEP